MANRLLRKSSTGHRDVSPYHYPVESKLPDLDETERVPNLDREGPPDEIKHWSKVDRWTALGKEIGRLRVEARKMGLSVHDVAPAKVAEFLELGKELRRSSR